MIQIAVVAIGGALGALSRFGVGAWIQHHWASSFPFGTFAVNVVGALTLGFVLTALPSKTEPIWLAFITTGFLGSFTTFSTFSWETITLIRSGSADLALLYVFLSLAIAFIGVLAGIWLGSFSHAS